MNDGDRVCSGRDLADDERRVPVTGDEAALVALPAHDARAQGPALGRRRREGIRVHELADLDAAVHAFSDIHHVGQAGHRGDARQRAECLGEDGDVAQARGGEDVISFHDDHGEVVPAELRVQVIEQPDRRILLRQVAHHVAVDPEILDPVPEEHRQQAEDDDDGQ
ncbi:MAG: hypothetical protein ABSG63_22050, partial [Spirochaetia bacterium]